MIIRTTRIQYKYGDEFYLKPFFDIHLGSESCDVGQFKRDIASYPPNTYFLFVGDLYDSITVTDPRYQKDGDATKSTAVLDAQVNLGCKILEPYADKIIGVGLGNHEMTALKHYGTNLTERTCRRLGVHDIGYSGLHRLIFLEGKNRGRTVVVRYHHGYGGGGRTAGSSLTKYEKEMNVWDADIFLYGHDHGTDVKAMPRLGLSGETLIEKPRWICVCGTYHKTFTEGPIPSYSELKGYPPRAIGGITIKMKPDKRWVKINATID